jgi:4'-phosphopantetheinyl transferase
VPALAEWLSGRELAGLAGARVWCTSLAVPTEAVARATELLSPGERLRAEAMPVEAARRRFVVARASLRYLLAVATGEAPDRLVLETGPHGKPFLPTAPGAPGLEFNLSHSHDLALIALATGRRVGIDVEWTKGSAPVEGIARRFFSDAEQAWLAEAPTGGRRKRFFRIWVRKEAYLKGRGEGISEWIHGTDFTSVADQRRPGSDQAGWQVRDVHGLPAGFVGSIAVARPEPAATPAAAARCAAGHQ